MTGGANFKIKVYSIDIQNKFFEVKEIIDLQKELQRADLLDTKLDEFDVISEMKYDNDGKNLKILQLRKKTPYLIEVNMLDYSLDMRKLECKYDDKSIFKYGLTYVQHHDSLNNFINYQVTKSNPVVFPDKDF